MENTWITESGKTYPLFPFDAPPVIKLPNGTTHHFKMWNEVTEKKREDLLKTIVVTSGTTLRNGEQPRDVRTDFTRSALKYYEMMIDKISGVAFNGNSPEDILDAHMPSGEFRDAEKTIPIPLWEMVGVPIRKEAALRIYGGKIEVEHPDVEEDEEDVDPFAELDLKEEVAKQQKKADSTVYRLTLNRDIVIRQEIGAEPIKGTGRFTDPTHLIRYHFGEPEAADFSKWEIKGHHGFSVATKNGGERAERYYNLDTVAVLFARLIKRIEGASLNGAEIHLASDPASPQRKAVLDSVPLNIKKLTVATLFNEMNSLGNA